jgi:hypothetical protein
MKNLDNIKIYPIILTFILPALIAGCRLRNQDEQYQEDELEDRPSLQIYPDLFRDIAEPICQTAPNTLTEAFSFDVLSPAPLSEPEPRIPFTDPIFGTCLVRVTDRNNDLSPDDSSPGLKNEYSRVQSFNADDSLLLARGIEGTWYVYDTHALLPFGEAPLGGEPRWDPEDPFRIFYYEDTALYSFHLIDGERRLLHDFSLDFPEYKLNMAWTRYEGSPSMDGSQFGLLVQDQEWNVVGFGIYDLKADRLTARRLFPEGIEVDSVTISPSGKYFLAFFDTYCERGQLGTDRNPCGLMVYDQDLKNGRGLLRIVGHADVAIDGTGQEVLVYQDIDTDFISTLDLASGKITPLLPIDFSQGEIGLHFSGRGFDQPGWALISTYAGWDEARTWMDNQVFAIELLPGGKVVRLAHTHSLVDEDQEHDYWAEPHATVNRSFTKVLFTSNWGRSGSSEVEVYMIILPENWNLRD